MNGIGLVACNSQHSTRMLQATALLLAAATFNIMLKVAFKNSVESSTNRMQHVAVLPLWNAALRIILLNLINATIS